MGTIWAMRLDACREAIESGRVRSISQAALDVGFSDLSHFSRAFRKRFGMAARSLLKGEEATWADAGTPGRE